MSGKKGMKKYPIEVRENVVARIRAGESQQALSREYGISRWAIQCWLKEPALPKRAQTCKNTGRVQVRKQTAKDGKRVIAGFSVLYRKEVRPRAKYAVIYRHRNEYPISVMCCFFQVSRSGYYNFVHHMVRTEKDYRRMWMLLEKQGIHRNPKTILRIMEKYNLLAEIRRRRKWVNMVQQIHKYENLLNRQFHADRPNSKWVTDISYIHTKQGVLYLSMIRDLYDNSIVAYKTTRQVHSRR